MQSTTPSTKEPRNNKTQIDFFAHLEQYRYIERTPSETARMLGLIELDRIAVAERAEL